MFDWGDLRYFLAIARGGNLSAAARGLGVNHSTVFRRLNAFESAVGMKLFDRRGGKYVLTAEGEETLRHATHIEEEALALDRHLSGRDIRLEGLVRVTTADTLAMALLPPHLTRFRRHHPGIRIELAVSNQMFSLTRREADVAIRPISKPEGAMVGRKISDIAFAVYGAEDYVLERGRPDAPSDLAEHDLVGPDDSIANLDASVWLHKIVPTENIGCRCDSLLAQYQMVRTGAGLGVLPCFLAEPDPELVRVLAPDPAMGSALWLFTHGDLQRTPRIRAFLDFMAESLAAERALLQGQNLS